MSRPWNDVDQVANRRAYARRVVRLHYPTSPDNPAGAGWCAYCLAFDATRTRWPCPANQSAARYLAQQSRPSTSTTPRADDPGQFRPRAATPENP